MGNEQLRRSGLAGGSWVRTGKRQIASWRELVRRVECVSGNVPMRWRCESRFDCGRRAARFERRDPALFARDGSLQVGLVSWEAGAPQVSDGTVTGDFVVAPGEQAMMAVLAADDTPLHIPSREGIERRLRDTAGVWQAWLACHSYEGPWRALPEVIGSDRNYDYRFCWVRDLCFTPRCTACRGHGETSHAAVMWLLGATRHTHPRIEPGTSKLGCWVAFDRLVELAEHGHVPPRHLSRWRHERDEVRRFIDCNLYASEAHSYLMEPAARHLDCGMLLAARRGFGETSRIAGMIDAISGELHADGALFYRYSGMRDEENAFLACSFWMVEAMAIAGRRDGAAELMDAAVELASDLGLYSEEMEPGTHAMRGNLPQALTHLALISAATSLSTPRN